MMTPLLNPMVSIRITITISTDSIRFTINVSMASLTRSGW